jgi:hypothetical protein
MTIIPNKIEARAYELVLLPLRLELQSRLH